jgi:hypothetical protein
VLIFVPSIRILIPLYTLKARRDTSRSEAMALLADILCVHEIISERNMFQLYPKSISDLTTEIMR